MTDRPVDFERFFDRLSSFDRGVDHLFDRFRGRPGIDAAASAISNLGDYGFLWSIIASAKGRRKGPARQRALRALSLSGIASFGVNAAIKQRVRRDRPDVIETTGLVPVRSPTSSSFPSGHTLAAFCTAVALADTRSERRAYLGFAAAVAISRIHLKAHHGSDVVAGAALGMMTGSVIRRALR